MRRTIDNWRVAAAVNTMLISLLTVFTVILYVQAQGTSDRIRNSQVEACEASLEPGGIRYIIAERIEADIQRQKTIDYGKFFPNIPPAELNRLLAEGRKRDRQQIHALLDVDCVKVYAR